MPSKPHSTHPPNNASARIAQVRPPRLSPTTSIVPISIRRNRYTYTATAPPCTATTPPCTATTPPCTATAPPCTATELSYTATTPPCTATALLYIIIFNNTFRVHPPANAEPPPLRYPPLPKNTQQPVRPQSTHYSGRDFPVRPEEKVVLGAAVWFILLN